MYEVVISEEAERELNAAVTFYESKNVGLGERFLLEISKAIASIALNPHASAILIDEYRRRNMRKFPYGIVYRVEGERILIFAVALPAQPRLLKKE